jgi:hypothetical protein
LSPTISTQFTNIIEQIRKKRSIGAVSSSDPQRPVRGGAVVGEDGIAADAVAMQAVVRMRVTMNYVLDVTDISRSF